ncbi:hypothetical protein EFA59_04255 [Weissella hellenica]|nr:hypothetical protein EFA59_04255 [Weissella hellenica]
MTLKKGYTLSKIAERLKRSRSTIIREVWRGTADINRII